MAAGTRSVWMETADPVRYDELRQDIDVEVCIIGAGQAGLATAHALVQEGVRTAILDKSQSGSGETGRTTAHLTSWLGRANPLESAYDPRRRPKNLKEFAKENLNVAKVFALDRLRAGMGERVDDLERDAGRVIRRDGDAVAAYRAPDGTLHERSALCTHLGCVVHWTRAFLGLSVPRIALRSVRRRDHGAHDDTTRMTRVQTHAIEEGMTTFHTTPRFPRGFACASRNCGIKESGKDLALFVSEVDAAAAAVFTRNHFPGAPVMLGRETLRAGVLRAVIVNSRVSNVGTGAAGIENARRMAAAAAGEVGCVPGHVLVSSTGVIGLPLPIERIEAGVRGMHADLQSDPLIGAEGIMTTDTYPKAVSLSVGDATITAVAKGSGMIAPNMATMLVYIFTDARIDAARLDAHLRASVADTFNMLSVDTDTSTSDTCAILANGLAGAVDDAAFAAGLLAVCTRTTELLARDGEGATKLLRVAVRGASSDDDARTVARSLVDSPLIKTMAYGADPNVGRILMAIGKCFDARVEPAHTDAWINGTQVIAGGMRVHYDEAALRASLAGDPVELDIDLGVGQHEARAWGCDLTEGYVQENAAYYSS